MTIIADSSFIYAVYNEKDSLHQRAIDFARSNSREKIILPDVILPEVSYLMVRDLGYSGLQQFIGKLLSADPDLEPLTSSDLEVIHEITLTYSDAAFDIVDCCIMAIVERLDVTRIATFDRRDFSIFRPKHCNFFELLP